MFNIIDESNSSGSKFSKGAITALAEATFIGRVISTDTELPVSILKERSSVVCKSLTLPAIDVNQVMTCVPEFKNLKGKTTKKNLRRLLATIKFRLGLKLSENPMIFLHASDLNEEGRSFKLAFVEAMKIKGKKKAFLA